MTDTAEPLVLAAQADDRVARGLEAAAEAYRHDPVNRPRHYTEHPSGYECIEITRATGHPNVSNAIKYMWRTGLKAEHLEDIRKAEWYLMDQITHFGYRVAMPFETRDKLLDVYAAESQFHRRLFFQSIAWGALRPALSAVRAIIEEHEASA